MLAQNPCSGRVGGGQELVSKPHLHDKRGVHIRVKGVQPLDSIVVRGPGVGLEPCSRCILCG